MGGEIVFFGMLFSCGCRKTFRTLRRNLGGTHLARARHGGSIENNWRILSTVLSLQAEAIDNARLKYLVQCRPHRIPSIVLAHEWLQQGDQVPQINLAYYSVLLIKEPALTYTINPEHITLET
jgi:two-component sensor histidine kinase